MIIIAVTTLLYIQWPSYMVYGQKMEATKIVQHKLRVLTIGKKEYTEGLPKFSHISKRKFAYPKAVRGIYVSGDSAGGPKFTELVSLVDSTELNAMVIDIKGDWGEMTMKLPTKSQYAEIRENHIKEPDKMMDEMEEKQIYPIARIVVFKDSILSTKKPELSFMDGDKTWTNGRGEGFVNPFLKEVWDYNVEIAIEAAKMGFQEIQFDYVRFPEGFENRDKQLTYDLGEYQNMEADNVQKRVHAVTNFVAYAREKLAEYDVKVSVDIFGYTATISEAPGIGQNFNKISENVDVISSMIYPSHWTTYFGIPKPDLEPYNLVKEYIKVEKAQLKKLESPPISRPWLQDFTASYLGKGNYQVYGKDEVEAQIKALYDEGINEYLLWNAGNNYSKNVNYMIGK